MLKRLSLTLLLIMGIYLSRAQDTIFLTSYKQTLYTNINSPTEKGDTLLLMFYKASGEVFLDISGYNKLTKQYLIGRIIGNEVIKGDTVNYYIYNSRTAPFEEGPLAIVKDIRGINKLFINEGNIVWVYEIYIKPNNEL